MRHWFVNRAAAHVAPSWLEAMPSALVLGQDELPRLSDADDAVVWYRLPADGEADTALAAIRAHSQAAVVILSDEPSEAGAALAIAAGAAGYANTHAAPAVLRQIAHVVENGGLWVGQALLRRLISGTSQYLQERPGNTRERWDDRLSEREAEVARRVAAGASNREIADRLFISERTVKAHLSAIFEKLGVRDRLQLSLRVNGIQV